MAFDETGVRRFSDLIEVPNDNEFAMERGLKDAFPELMWENLAENWGKIRIAGTDREQPPALSISISRNEPPSPFHLVIAIRGVSLERAEESYRALRARVSAALI